MNRTLYSTITFGRDNSYIYYTQIGIIQNKCIQNALLTTMTQITHCIQQCNLSGTIYTLFTLCAKHTFFVQSLTKCLLGQINPTQYVWWDTGVPRLKILVVLLKEVLNFMTRIFLHKKYK
jgi:hypothetical protein